MNYVSSSYFGHSVLYNVSICNHIYFHKPVTCKAVSVTQRASPKHVDALGMLIIWHPFKPIFFTIFQPRIEACPTCGQFSEKFFCMWMPKFTSTELPIIPATS